MPSPEIVMFDESAFPREILASLVTQPWKHSADDVRDAVHQLLATYAHIDQQRTALLAAREALQSLVSFIDSEHDLHAVFVTKDSAAFAQAKAALASPTAEKGGDEHG